MRAKLRLEAGGFESIAREGLELVPRNCTLTPYKKLTKVPAVSTRGPFVAYASPDSTYAVTRQLVEAARKSILIGIYDFSAVYIQELLIDAVDRGVTVELMLDIDSDKEQKIYDALAKGGCACVPAPSCASDYVSYFRSSHEKVIVIDNEWTLVQSGNYSERSIPKNEKDGSEGDRFVYGNRDMGLAVKDARLALFFRKVLEADTKLELDAEGVEALKTAREHYPDLERAVRRPRTPPPTLFKSRTFQPQGKVAVQPVLTPDNYMSVVPGFLRTARRSIDIEQQYIRPSQPQIQRLLEEIKSVRRDHDVTVRVILAPPMASGEKLRKELKAMEALEQFGLRVGRDVKLLNRRHFTHCHNKLIVIDGKRVLVSSQNWSDAAVSENREAGLIVDSAPIAGYYRGIFDVDWNTAVRPGAAEEEEAVGLEARAPGAPLIRVTLADYVEV